MGRKNKRDKQYEPKELSTSEFSYDYPSEKQKPVRRRKGKFDKKIYRQDNE